MLNTSVWSGRSYKFTPQAYRLNADQVLNYHNNLKNFRDPLIILVIVPMRMSIANTYKYCLRNWQCNFKY